MRLLLIPALFFGASFLALFALGEHVDIPSSFDEVVPWLQSFRDWAWAVGFAVIVIDSVLPMPFHPSLFALGVIYGPVVGGVLGGLAAVASGVVGLYITRSMGRRAAVFLVGERDLERTESFFERWGFFAIALSRAIAGPAEAVVLLAGLSKMPFASVFYALCLGGFPMAFLLAGLGAFAGERPLLALLGGFLICALVTWLGWALWRSPRWGALRVRR